MGKSISIAGMLLVVGLLLVQPAKADGVVTYQVGGHGSEFSFSLPQDATPASVTWNGILVFHNVAGEFQGTPYTFATVEIGTAGYMNLTDYWATGSQTKYAEIELPGIFTWNADGTVTLLSGGTFAIADYHIVDGGPFDYTLTITDPPGSVTVPEPASLSLLGLGGLALAAFRRRKTA